MLSMFVTFRVSKDVKSSSAKLMFLNIPAIFVTLLVLKLLTLRLVKFQQAPNISIIFVTLLVLK